MKKTNRKANSVTWEGGAKILNLVSAYYFQALQRLNSKLQCNLGWKSKCIN